MDPKVVFTPVVEPKLPGAFITEHPRDVMPTNAAKIPFLTGLNYDEGLIKSAGRINDSCKNAFGKYSNLNFFIFCSKPTLIYLDYLKNSLKSCIMLCQLFFTTIITIWLFKIRRPTKSRHFTFKIISHEIRNKISQM